MATQLKKTVMPSGGDYTSLEACMNANEQNLVTADKYFDVEIDGTWSSADGSGVVIHNYTTDSTRYINIYTTSGCRHDGKWNTAKYRIAAWVGNLVTISSSYVTITGIQAQPTYSGYNGLALDNGTAVKLVKCIIRGGSGGRIINAFGSGTFTAENCIFYTGSDSRVNQTSSTFNNCIYLKTLSPYSSGTVVARNCYASSYSGVTQTTCASTDTSADGTALDSIALSTDNFTNVTAGSEDFHLVAGSALINAGTDLSATFTDDIDGDTRSSWDIGADEYVAASGWVRGGKLKFII